MGELEKVAAAIGAQADERWAELDQNRRVPADLQQAALSAGLLRCLVPVDLGGKGAKPLEWFRCGVELARHEASFGWVITQGAVELGYIAAGGEPSWARDVLGDTTAYAASTVNGLGSLRYTSRGLVLDGRWAFNTGVHGASWIGGLAAMDGSEPRDVRLVYVPATQATILDDWDTEGLRGSGSNSVVISEQVIDPAWMLRPFSAVSGQVGPHRCLLGNGNWPIATSVAATQLGSARRAIDEAATVVRRRMAPSGTTPSPDPSAAIRGLLEAESTWNACRASIERELEAMWCEAVSKGALSVPQRVSLFAANSLASSTSAQIVNQMCELAGSVSVSRSHPLSRTRRDVHALRAHRALNGDAMEHAGRVWLGIDKEHRRI